MAVTSRTFPLERVQGYTDAVFAIAATLLVLDLTTSAFAAVRTDAEMWRALGDEWQSLLAFVVSFVLLSLLWMIHVAQFRDLARADGTLVWLNNVRLLFIVLIPFTTSLNAEDADFVAGRVLLPLNFFLASVASLVSYLWASSRGGHLLRDDVKDSARAESVGGLAAVIAGAIAVALSPFVGSVAFFAYLLNPLLERLLARRRHPQT